MESVQSKLFKAMLRIINIKKMWEVTGDKLKKDMVRKQSAESSKPPKSFEKKFNISKEEINGYGYYVLRPLKNLEEKHILFFHGGGYVYEIMGLEWRFIGKLLDSLKCTITVPMYPLTPKHQYKEVFDMIVPIYEEIISEVKPKDVVIMGDSAGGGISLALAELLKEKRMPQPGNIILISPALDMTFSNPEIYKVEKLDPISAVPGLIDIMNWYGGEKGADYHLVSPIYGSLEGLGKISLFIGTNDILYPDAKRFKEILDKKRININYYAYPYMIHVWPLFFFPESKKATGQIIEIIRSS